MKVVVFGGSGFVGRAVVAALRSNKSDVNVNTVKAPRMEVCAEDYDRAIETNAVGYNHALEACRHADVVINAAGLARPVGSSMDDLLAANAALPGLIGRAVRDAGVARYIHVSSAAVQGRIKCLTDAPATAGFSPYSQSKIAGEHAALKFGPRTTVVHRPAGVHAADRGITRQIARFAASPVSFVGGDGNRPTPQSLVHNVGDALAFLAKSVIPPPPITTQPWEGVTTGRLLQSLGGRVPRHVPLAAARTAVECLNVAGRPLPTLRPYGRRVELLLLGQAQQRSWLTENGWLPPEGIDEWDTLGDLIWQT